MIPKKLYTPSRAKGSLASAKDRALCSIAVLVVPLVLVCSSTAHCTGPLYWYCYCLAHPPASIQPPASKQETSVGRTQQGRHQLLCSQAGTWVGTKRI